MFGTTILLAMSLRPLTALELLTQKQFVPADHLSCKVDAASFPLQIVGKTNPHLARG